MVRQTTENRYPQHIKYGEKHLGDPFSVEKSTNGNVKLDSNLNGKDTFGFTSVKRLRKNYVSDTEEEDKFFLPTKKLKTAQEVQLPGSNKGKATPPTSNPKKFCIEQIQVDVAPLKGSSSLFEDDQKDHRNSISNFKNDCSSTFDSGSPSTNSSVVLETLTKLDSANHHPLSDNKSLGIESKLSDVDQKALPNALSDKNDSHITFSHPKRLRMSSNYRSEAPITRGRKAQTEVDVLVLDSDSDGEATVEILKDIDAVSFKNKFGARVTQSKEKVKSNKVVDVTESDADSDNENSNPKQVSRIFQYGQQKNKIGDVSAQNSSDVKFTTRKMKIKALPGLPSVINVIYAQTIKSRSREISIVSKAHYASTKSYTNSTYLKNKKEGGSMNSETFLEQPSNKTIELEPGHSTKEGSGFEVSVESETQSESMAKKPVQNEKPLESESDKPLDEGNFMVKKLVIQKSCNEDETTHTPTPVPSQIGITTVRDGIQETGESTIPAMRANGTINTVAPGISSAKHSSPTIVSPKIDTLKRATPKGPASRFTSTNSAALRLSIPKAPAAKLGSARSALSKNISKNNLSSSDSAATSGIKRFTSEVNETTTQNNSNPRSKNHLKRSLDSLPLLPPPPPPPPPAETGMHPPNNSATSALRLKPSKEIITSNSKSLSLEIEHSKPLSTNKQRSQLPVNGIPKTRPKPLYSESCINCKRVSRSFVCSRESECDICSGKKVKKKCIYSPTAYIINQDIINAYDENKKLKNREYTRKYRAKKLEENLKDYSNVVSSMKAKKKSNQSNQSTKSGSIASPHSLNIDISVNPSVEAESHNSRKSHFKALKDSLDESSKKSPKTVAVDYYKSDSEEDDDEIPPVNKKTPTSIKTKIGQGTKPARRTGKKSPKPVQNSRHKKIVQSNSEDEAYSGVSEVTKDSEVEDDFDIPTLQSTFLTQRVLQDLDFEKRDGIIKSLYSGRRNPRKATQTLATYKEEGEDHSDSDALGYDEAAARDEMLILSEAEEERMALRGKLSADYWKQKRGTDAKEREKLEAQRRRDLASSDSDINDNEVMILD